MDCGCDTKGECGSTPVRIGGAVARVARQIAAALFLLTACAAAGPGVAASHVSVGLCAGGVIGRREGGVITMSLGALVPPRSCPL